MPGRKSLGNAEGILSSCHSFSFFFSRSTGATGALPGEGDISAMSKHVSLNPGEYSYFSPRVLSMWAGPEHWRFQPRQPRECLGQGVLEFWAGRGWNPGIPDWEGLSPGILGWEGLSLSFSFSLSLFPCSPAAAPGLEKDSRQKIPKKPFKLNFQEKIDFQAHFQATKVPTEPFSHSSLEFPGFGQLQLCIQPCPFPD